jgi:hypothetical protein
MVPGVARALARDSAKDPSEIGRVLEAHAGRDSGYGNVSRSEETLSLRHPEIAQVVDEGLARSLLERVAEMADAEPALGRGLVDREALHVLEAEPPEQGGDRSLRARGPGSAGARLVRGEPPELAEALDERGLHE